MPKTDSITQSRLKESLHYDPETGLFTWLQRPARRIHIGDVAGSLGKNGYISIRIDGVTYYAHRLSYLYVLGWMPEQVDHDNRIRNDNRWKNLNPATQLINNKNQPLSSKNTSGHCGVYWDKLCRKWRAYMSRNNKTIYIGVFTDKSDAIIARQAADIEYNFHPNHGK